MAVLEWDKTGEHWFETGVDHGVLYPATSTGKYGKGVVWNGLTAVTESPEGAEPNDQYADNIKYLTLRSAETFGATIEAFTYPEEFRGCDGRALLAPGVEISQQAREAFGFCYRTLKGNDIKGQDAGYILHLVYGCTVSPSERNYQTVNDSPEAITFSWELDSTPVAVTGHKPTSLVTIDSTEVDPVMLARLERVLYGMRDVDPRLPMPDEIVGILTTPVPLFTVSAPEQTDSVGTLKMSDLVDPEYKIDTEAKKISGTANFVYDLAESEGNKPITANWYAPVTLLQEYNANVRVAYKIANPRPATVGYSKFGNTILLPVTKNMTGATLTITQNEGGEDTQTDVYDLSELVRGPAPVDAIAIDTKAETCNTYMSDKHSEKTVDDLQQDLEITASVDTLTAKGTLHAVTGLTSFYKPEKADGHFMIFEMKPTETSHRIGVKESSGKVIVGAPNDFIMLARVDDYNGGPIELYEYDSEGTTRINTYQLKINQLVLE